MLYFRHSELVNTYHVSLKTVHNWIDAAKHGKLDLELYEHNGRTYIANKPANTVLLQKIAEEGKKYRNARFQKVVTPKPEFYDIFSRRQILDIISNLSVHGEILRQYNYLNGGANNWDNWLKRLEKETAPNILTGTMQLMESNLPAIESHIENYKKVNIIDIGVGNARPVKQLLQRLLDTGKLNRYIALDISQTMLEIAQRNIEEWFDGAVKFEGHLRDISYERFDDLLVDDRLSKDADETINIMLILGGTLTNFPVYSDPLKVIYGSMDEDDLILYTDKADTEASRKYFDFNSSSAATELSPNHRMILDLLNINSSLYDVEMGFDEKKLMRYIRVRLNTALTVKFSFGESERNVYLEKGDTILLLRVWHLTALEIVSEFEKAGFVLLHSNTTKNRQYVLTISGLDNKQRS